ncbi:helix-turn-helix domain-containing protein [Fodinisporobacter ferrooxydans]|uniref:Helix-turn-helix domain-containing protein n=1 Tax=Fodinisporobacter ferrooxydans TaxID=2901836 RepID=A0ABY4CJY8_9BACL|nr:helix-turn-helix domain-containing protein [Alicyclobacillaceae bacterium MYW30-H2]
MKVTEFVGNRIKELRKRFDINAKELALSIGVSQSFLSAIENGVKKCSLETIDKICSTLNITLSEFFADDTQELPPDIHNLLRTIQTLTPTQRELLDKFLREMKGSE